MDLRERGDMGEHVWKAVGLAAGATAATLARSLAVASWKRARTTAPPTNPASPDTDWGEALSWAVLTGMVVGVARLIAARWAAEGWRRATGAYPPGLEEVG